MNESLDEQDFNYYAGAGHPTSVDETGKSTPKQRREYDPWVHGYPLVMCPLRNLWCHNDELFYRDYGAHLRQRHNGREIDPVQERIMMQGVLMPKGIRKSKYVWAPFPWQIPKTLYDMHLWALANDLAT